jgi:hypothetical protein
LFLSGGTSNTDPNLSLGGNISNTEITANNIHNLFRRITETEAGSGVTLYRLVYFKNANATDTMRTPVAYLVRDTLSVDDLALYSPAQADKNTSESAIANEFTAPVGSRINFTAAATRSTGMLMVDLAPGEYIGIWLRITVNPGASIFPDNSFIFRIEVNGTGTSDPPVPDPDPETGTEFSMAAVGDCSCNSDFENIWNRIKARNPGFVILNGDLAYSSGSSCFVTRIGNTWIAKSVISFGNHDVDESESQPSTRNALINAWGLTGDGYPDNTYYERVFRNVYILVLNSEEDPESNPQLAKMEALLRAAKNNAAYEWIVVMHHRPIYGPASNHANETGVRDTWDEIFDECGVDFVITSHNHNIFHTKLIKYNSGSPSNPTQIGTDPNYSYSRATANHGKFYIGSGAGGRSHYDIDSVPSYVVYSNDSNYAYLFMDFSQSGKKITFKFYSSSDSLLKEWTLTHT